MSKLMTFITFLVFFCYGLSVGSSTPQFSDNVKVQTTLTNGVCSSMVLTKNYPCQEHQVTTGDGYILSLQNIPFGRSGNSSGQRPPVLLQHGLTMDAVSWLLSPPEESLAFVLADSGFDVWVVSARGTKYSRQHTSLATYDPAYWNWSWDQLAAYDLPATIQYIHDQTGQNLHYVGHSLGTLSVLGALSKGLLANMLRSVSLLCPIAYIGHISLPLARYSAQTYMAEGLLAYRIYELNPKSAAVMNPVKGLCSQRGIDCSNLLTAATGPNCCLNSSTMDVFLQNEPQSTSTKNVVHLAQMIREGSIRMYNYGNMIDNTRIYGQAIPPSYDMTNIPSNIPLFVAHGGADELSVPIDVKQLLDGLPDRNADNLVVLYTPQYGHADYVMGYNAKETVYDPMVAFFRQH